MVVLGADGSIINGDASQLTPAGIEEIITAPTAGEITDYSKDRLIVYAAHPEKNLIFVTIGHWGTSASANKSVINVIIVLSIATIFLSIVATYLLASDINNPLKKVLEFLRTISGGDTGARLRAYSEDEIGDFARELARTTALLEDKTDQANNLIKRIMETSATIEQNAQHTQSTAQQQATEVNEQAGAITEILSTSNEIVATAQQIAAAAADVQKSAEKNLLSCQTGNERVNEALEGFNTLGRYVDEISKRVVALGDDIRKITGVVEIIEEVAVQINLLSLNAQIEAETSGETGKRFGVVAEEIRRLAENTMDSAKLIRGLVDSTLKSTESTVEPAKKGLGLVDKSAEFADAIGKTIKEIEWQADSTASAAGTITLSTSQQKTASEQMAGTISDINASAQHIKSNTDHVLSAMSKLSDTAAKLMMEFSGNQ